MPDDAYATFVRERLASGDDPNVIQESIESALISEATDWSAFGDGIWRLDTVCPVCGKGYAGVCGHSGMYEGGPILRREFVPGKYGDPDIVRCGRCGRTGRTDDLRLEGLLNECVTCRADRSPYVPLHREVDHA